VSGFLFEVPGPSGCAGLTRRKQLLRGAFPLDSEERRLSFFLTPLFPSNSDLRILKVSKVSRPRQEHNFADSWNSRTPASRCGICHWSTPNCPSHQSKQSPAIVRRFDNYKPASTLWRGNGFPWGSSILKKFQESGPCRLQRNLRGLTHRASGLS
jgi:hypothetical protein